MRRRKRAVSFAALLAALLPACGADDPALILPLEASVVYGDDDRLDVYAHPDEGLARIARESIVAIIPSARIELQSDGSYAVRSPLLQSSEQRVCPDEAFALQYSAAACSGVLVADDLVLTAGHCVDSLSSWITQNALSVYFRFQERRRL